MDLGNRSLDVNLLLVICASTATVVLTSVVTIFGGVPEDTNNVQLAMAQGEPDINNNHNNNETTFLYIQSAQAGSLLPQSNDIASKNYTLTLKNISSTTIAFSDRPQRLLFQIDTGSFVDNWTAGEDSFAFDPPNAAMVLLSPEGNKEDVIVAELLNPMYDRENKTLQFDIISLSTEEEEKDRTIDFSEIGSKGNLSTIAEVPDSFGIVNLFIDANKDNPKHTGNHLGKDKPTQDHLSTTLNGQDRFDPRD